MEDYLSWCKARGLSPRTTSNSYGYPLRGILLPFCAEQGIDEPSQIDQRVLDRLTNQLLEKGAKGRPLSKHSVHSYVRAVNHFLKWASREGEVAKDLRAQTPKLPKRLVDVLSRDEIRSMEQAAQTERDKLIIRVLADTGIRVGELVGLRLDDVKLQGDGRQGRKRYLYIRGKGERDRLVPIDDGLAHRLKVYSERTRPKAPTDRLFVSLTRRPGRDYEPLDSSGVEQMLRVVADRAGIQKRVYPHLFRHSYATWALRRGVNPLLVQQTLGHSSLEMITHVYSHLTPTDAHDAMIRLLREDPE